MTDEIPESDALLAEEHDGTVRKLLAEAAQKLHAMTKRRREAPKTACPACGCRTSRVLDSRDFADYASTYTRCRVCANRACGAIYTTEEIPRAILGYQKSA